MGVEMRSEAVLALVRLFAAFLMVAFLAVRFFSAALLTAGFLLAAFFAARNCKSLDCAPNDKEAGGCFQWELV
jgi:hypothetical protein